MYNQAGEVQASIYIGPGKNKNIAASMKAAQQRGYNAKSSKKFERKTACEIIMGQIRANKLQLLSKACRCPPVGRMRRIRHKQGVIQSRFCF